MKATLNDRVLAESSDVAEHGGHCYFRRADVRMERLEPAAKTACDLACPHGVRFYDVVIDGMRHERMAWSYEAPLAPLLHVGGRIGFWKDVDVRLEGSGS